MKPWATLLLALGAAIVASPAGANHVPGGTYRGTHSNGGTVELRLASNGGVQFFGATSLRLGGTCPAGSYTFPGGLYVAATDHSFVIVSNDSSSLTGSFPTPTTARGTLKLSCSSTTLNWSATLGASGGPPPPPPPPASANRPSLGFDRLYFVRKGGTVTVRALFSTCGGTPPYRRLFVRERLRVAGKFVAAVKLSRTLPAGRPTTRADGTPCRYFGVRWPLAAKLFGNGSVVISLRVTDAAGRSTLELKTALRAPKR